jgi:hypothetical protein
LSSAEVASVGDQCQGFSQVSSDKARIFQNVWSMLDPMSGGRCNDGELSARRCMSMG